MRIIGAAEGAIIPTIITAHIENTYAELEAPKARWPAT